MQINNRNPNWARPPLLDRRKIRGGLRGFPRSKAHLLAIMKYYSADLLTLARLILALALVGIALVDGRANPAADIWILVLAWSTDMVDGRLSRMFKIHRQTWLGKRDVYVDMFVSLAVLAYLAVTGLLPLVIALAYLLAWGALFLRFGVPDLFAQAFQNPIYAFFLFVTVRDAPQVLPWLLLFALAAFVLFRRRLFELLRGVLQAVRKGTGQAG